MKNFKRDALLIFVLLLCAAALWFVMRPGEPGAYAVVTVHGKEYARYPLAENQTVTIGEDAYNVLTIADGKAFISDANCGDHTCIHTGSISLQGEQIICLPHELIVEIIGGTDSDLDASTH